MVLAGVPQAPAALFEALPGRQVLTLNMDVPEAWLVEAVEAEVCPLSSSSSSTWPPSHPAHPSSGPCMFPFSVSPLAFTHVQGLNAVQ